MDLESLFARRIGMSDINIVVEWSRTDPCDLDNIWKLTHSKDRRVSANALWVMTHLPESDRDWLISLQDEMIDMLLAEQDTSKRRMLLQLLREQDFNPEEMRTDLLDFCLSKINSECEPYAIRCFSIYVAFKMCRHYPELISELEQHLDIMSKQPLSPGLKSALRQTKTKISRLKMSCQPPILGRVL